ncbi:MAG: hypothetical protein ABEK59_01525 [Halobacteria archaeon]
MIFVWILLVFGVTVAIYSGKVSHLLTPQMLSIDRPFGLFGFAGGLMVLGALVLVLLKKRAWKRAGRRANLKPKGGGLFSKPDLVGSLNGRKVRARTIKKKTGSDGESSSNKSTFTVVEADLDESPEEGLVIGIGDGEGVSTAQDMPVDFDTGSVNGFAVVGSTDIARETLTTRAENALRDPELLDSVLVGNVADVLLEAVPESDGFILGKLTEGIEKAIRDGTLGESGKVRAETKGVILDSDELEEQIQAVSAVADGFETVGRYD